MTNPNSIDPRQHIEQLLRAALFNVAQDLLAADQINSLVINVERPNSAQHGDFASNLAMQLARLLKRNPRELAKTLADALPESQWVERAEVAGAGFINVFLSRDAKYALVRAALRAAADFGRGKAGVGQRVLLEFVSANPTGPLHVGHGRGAAYGLSLKRLLQFAGYVVASEYYINDAGRQMDILALSTWLRYLEAGGQTITFPSKAYQGDYVRDMAAQLRRLHAERFTRPLDADQSGGPDEASDAEGRLDHLIAAAKRLLGTDYSYVHQFALAEQMDDCRRDLEEFGVRFDSWFSERSLYEAGLVQRALDTLETNGHLYTQDGALWFRATAFGDEKDRVLRRENGEFTYFAADIAYHLNKFERGFDRLINVWGADHHGYIPRVGGAITALGRDVGAFRVALVQLVNLFRAGTRVAMSTRQAEYVTLRELREEVGNDAARFFYVMRKIEQRLDFDLDLAKSQSTENPVYYVQMAHARVCSMLAQWGGDPATLVEADLTPLILPRELELMTSLQQFAEVAEIAARELAPHLMAQYLRDLAALFHAYYNDERILVDRAGLRTARLALCQAVRHVLANGLSLLGVTSPDKM